MAMVLYNDITSGISANKNNNNNGNDGGNNYYYDLTNYYKQLYEDAKQQELDNITNRLNSTITGYNQNLTDLNNNYQNLINTNETNRYRTQRAMREAQANRGQLDTGLSRSENLYMDSNYNNNLNNILTQRESDRSAIKQKIADATNTANEDKAKVVQNYANKVAKL